MSDLIFVDGRLLHRPVSGLERFVSNLALSIARREPTRSLALTVEWPSRVDPEITRRCMIVPVFDERHLAESVRQSAPSLYHLTWLGYSAGHYLPLAVARSGVLTIPDFILWDHPEYAPADLHRRFQTALRACIPWADRILVYSEHCKAQVAERLGVPDSEIGVVPLAADERFRIPAAAATLDRVRRRIGRPFLLTVGKDYPHKNLNRLIEAFGHSGLRDHALVIAGESVWPRGRNEILALAKKVQVDDRLVLLDHFPDEDLPALYQSSDALVYPSLEEGFGLPPLEAMAAGVPVVCSDATSLSEVVGDASLLVDATQTEALAEAMARVVADTALRKCLIESGSERARQFTWERTAALTLEAYRMCLDRAPMVRRAPLPGPFLQDFASETPFVARVLGESATCPHVETALWVEAGAFSSPFDPQPIAQLRRQAVVDWLRSHLASTAGVEVMLADAYPESLPLSSVLEFARPSRVVVVGHGDVVAQDPVSPAMETWHPNECLARAREKGWIDARAARELDGGAVALVSLPDEVAATFGSEAEIACAFPVDAGQSLPDPDCWVQALTHRHWKSGNRWVLIGDDRAALDPDWVAQFRNMAAQQGSPWRVIWISSGRHVEPLLRTLADPDPFEWLLFPLDSLTEDHARILSRRSPGLRVALAGHLPRTGQAEQLLAELIANAWTLRPEAVLVSVESPDSADSAAVAAADEIRAVVDCPRGETIFTHILKLQQDLNHSRRREKEIYEQALQSNLEGLRSYQEQVERYDRQHQVLTEAMARLAAQLGGIS